MAPLFANLGGGSGNTGVTGAGMFPNTAVGQVARRRNGRPDTPDEIYADQVARGEIPPGTAGPVGSGTTIFNQPQQFPGNTFGTNDWSRAGTFLGNDLYNSLGGLLPQYQGLFGQGQDLYNQGQGLYNQGQGLYNLGQNLYGQYGALVNTAQLPEQIGRVASFNADVMGGKMPEAIEQLTAPYLARASSDINAQADTAKRQALDQLPRGGLAAEAVMGANDSAIKGIADAAGNLYSSVAPMAIQNALNAGRPENLANLYGAQGNLLGQQGSILGQQGGIIGQQGSILGQQGGLLGQQGTIMGQRALGPWNIIQGLGGLLNQRRGIDVSADATKGK